MVIKKVTKKTNRPGTDCVIEIDDNHYLVSQTVARDHGEWETMIFPCDEDGNVSDWGELYVYRGWEEYENSASKFYDITERERMRLDLEDGDTVV